MNFFQFLWNYLVKLLSNKPLENIVVPLPTNPVVSAADEVMLLSLAPKVAVLFRSTIYLARAAGLNVALYSGLRSFSEQDALYSLGRDAAGKVIDKKAIVTNAKGGESYHNYGLAGDIVFRDSKGNWTWDVKSVLWKKLGAIGESTGLYYGGNFHMVDVDHFQYIKGLPNLVELKKLYLIGGMQEVWSHLV